jgi:polyvinyl alcohol dehydrogenase (cytochrome)
MSRSITERCRTSTSLVFGVIPMLVGLGIATWGLVAANAQSRDQAAALPAGAGEIDADAAPGVGAPLFEERCGACHTAAGVDLDGRIAPSLIALRLSSTEQIYASMNAGGKMEIEATGLSDEEKRSIAAFLTGRPLLDERNVGIGVMDNQCASNPPLGDITKRAAWNGWSPSLDNARNQTADVAGLSAQDVRRLELKWAFGLPGGGSSLSQPTVAAGRVFVGSDNAAVYSLDAETGCAYWSFQATAPGRFAPIVAPIVGREGSEYAVYFVTRPGRAYALDARDGTLIWQRQLEGMVAVSGSAAYHDGRLYVPITGTETLSGADPNYECCRSRGGVAALDANGGDLVWQVDSLPEPLERLGVNAAGTQLWGPAGAGVWNTPTIDPERGRIYIGTGNNYGPIASSTSDSILALDMDDGRIVWSHQEFEDDSFMVGCGPTNAPGGNCPEVLGPDWDFGGGSVILQHLGDGRDALIAAGKGGVAIALDPDRDGRLLWRTVLYSGRPPSPLGLVLFGGAADGARVYFPLQRPGGGLTALRVDSGARDWSVSLETDPRGHIGPASAIPGAVFVGAWDGILRAVSTENGATIWSYDTRREYDTVNGIEASGGSLGSTGATIANGMVFVGSGYVGVQNGYPGNVVLAFAVQ